MIDIHVHLGKIYSVSRAFKGTIEVTIDDLISYMDENEIDIVCLLSLPGKVDPYVDAYLAEEVLKASKKYPDRIIPFCAVDPRNPRFKERIRALVKKGCRGFGEYKVKLKVNDERSLRVYEICSELKIPVLLHIDNTYNPDIYKLEYVLEHFKDTIFILHGPGWWKYISANVDPREDYPRGKIIPGGKVEEILSEYRNAYADISAHSGYNALNRDRAYARKFVEEFYDRILYGTDFPCLAPDGTQYGPNRKHIDLLRELRLSKEVLEYVTSENALKLLTL